MFKTSCLSLLTVAAILAGFRLPTIFVKQKAAIKKPALIVPIYPRSYLGKPPLILPLIPPPLYPPPYKTPITTTTTTSKPTTTTYYHYYNYYTTKKSKKYYYYPYYYTTYSYGDDDYYHYYTTTKKPKYHYHHHYDDHFYPSYYYKTTTTTPYYEEYYDCDYKTSTTTASVYTTTTTTTTTTSSTSTENYDVYVKNYMFPMPRKYQNKMSTTTTTTTPSTPATTVHNYAPKPEYGVRAETTTATVPIRNEFNYHYHLYYLDPSQVKLPTLNNYLTPQPSKSPAYYKPYKATTKTTTSTTTLSPKHHTPAPLEFYKPIRAEIFHTLNDNDDNSQLMFDDTKNILYYVKRNSSISVTN